jgi:hypothetical protein
MGLIGLACPGASLARRRLFRVMYPGLKNLRDLFHHGEFSFGLGFVHDRPGNHPREFAPAAGNLPAGAFGELGG